MQTTNQYFTNPGVGNPVAEEARGWLNRRRGWERRLRELERRSEHRGLV